MTVHRTQEDTSARVPTWNMKIRDFFTLERLQAEGDKSLGTRTHTCLCKEIDGLISREGAHADLMTYFIVNYGSRGKLKRIDNAGDKCVDLIITVTRKGGFESYCS